MSRFFRRYRRKPRTSCASHTPDAPMPTKKGGAGQPTKGKGDLLKVPTKRELDKVYPVRGAFQRAGARSHVKTARCTPALVGRPLGAPRR